MRPGSIVKFERFYLAALVIGFLSVVLNWENTLTQLNADSNVAALDSGFVGTIFVAILVISFVINLILWFLVARKAVNIAKWIIVAFFALSLISIPFSLPQMHTLKLATTLIIMALKAAAVFMLFQADAVAWLKNRGTH